MNPHPALIRRYRRILALHRSILPPGEQTAARQIQAIDRYGILSMSEELGPEKVARMLRVRVEAGAMKRPERGPSVDAMQSLLRRARELLSASAPTNMGGKPDLFYPDVDPPVHHAIYFGDGPWDHYDRHVFDLLEEIDHALGEGVRDE